MLHHRPLQAASNGVQGLPRRFRRAGEFPGFSRSLLPLIGADLWHFYCRRQPAVGTAGSLNITFAFVESPVWKAIAGPFIAELPPARMSVPAPWPFSCLQINYSSPLGRHPGVHERTQIHAGVGDRRSGDACPAQRLLPLLSVRLQKQPWAQRCLCHPRGLGLCLGTAQLGAWPQAYLGGLKGFTPCRQGSSAPAWTCKCFLQGTNRSFCCETGAPGRAGYAAQLPQQNLTEAGPGVHIPATLTSCIQQGLRQTQFVEGSFSAASSPLRSC